MISYDEVRAKVAQEYIDAGVDSSMVWLQSFNIEDIEYWLANYGTTFGPQAVFLDNGYCNGTLADCSTDDLFETLFSKGVRYIAPPQQMLVKVHNGAYAPSEYALAAKAAGFKIITWTLERSGPLASGGGWYYGTSNDFTNNDGDTYELLHVLVQDVGIVGMFSDWPATVTFYASCIQNPAKLSSGRCADVKDYYKQQQCCGIPGKSLDPSIPMNF